VDQHLCFFKEFVMNRLMGIGACVAFALLLTSCGEQTKKTKDTAKTVTTQTTQTREQVDNAGKTLPEVDLGKAAEAAGKTLQETQAKITESAKKASEALGEQFTKATEQAAKSLQSVKGGPELLQKIGDVIPSLQQTLAGITDKESAQKALPKLDELEGTVSKLSGQFDKLPENAKKTIGELVQKGTSTLQPLVDNVLALPAVQAIRPKVEAIMERLKGLKS
jgi:F0F1-type ATP synthase membrane subunit b/b'